MRHLLMLVLFLAYTVSAVSGDLLQLKSMITKVTGKSALKNYISYGCYCGKGGSGIPRDATDWCCWRHDWCYDNLLEKGCRPYSTTYEYHYSRDQVICGPEPNCQNSICYCDKVLAYCLKNHLSSYDKYYRNYDGSLCN